MELIISHSMSWSIGQMSLRWVAERSIGLKHLTPCLLMATILRQVAMELLD